MYVPYSGKGNVLDKILKKCERAYASDYPIIWIETDEDELIEQFIDKQSVIDFFSQTSVPGCLTPVPYQESPQYEYVKVSRQSTLSASDCCLRRTNGTPNNVLKENTEAVCPSLRIVRQLPTSVDLNKYLECQITKSRKPASERNYPQNDLLVVFSTDTDYPSEIKNYVVFVDVDLPDRDEIEYTINSIFHEYDCNLIVPKYMELLKTAFQGFNCSKIRQTLKAILYEQGGRMDDFENEADFKAKILKIIEDEKIQLLKKGQILELVKIKDNDPEIGGLTNYSNWLKKIIQIVNNADESRRNWGITCPKGVLLCGIPGTGKSLSAKKTAQALDLPLIKMDVGSLMSSHVGSSEKNMREALKIAEALSPCVLFVDEIEKGMSGAGASGDADSGTFKRMFATFLTWMQEKDFPCFIFATANDISGLPDEFTRNDRFDQAFALYMPTSSECADIYRNIVKNTQKTADKNKHLFEEGFEKWNFNILVELSIQKGRKKFLTGADIKTIVRQALIRLSEDKLDKACTISFDMFKDAVDAVLDTERTFGDSNENMRSIALCYIKLMTKSFTPASDEVLFDKTSFNENLHQITIDITNKLNGVCSTGETSGQNIEAVSEPCSQELSFYDEALFEEIKKHINSLARPYIQEALAKKIRG